MKKTLAALAAIVLFGRALATEVYFSPNGGAQAALVQEVGQARSEIRVMSYQMTSKHVEEALVAAQARGVDVRVIVDRSQRRATASGAQYCCAYKLAAAVPTQLDAKHPIQHNKVIVIDRQTVITGSFNFSNAAEKANAENMLVLRDAALAQKYLDNWKLHSTHSEAF